MEAVMKFTIHGAPRTKKNSQQIIQAGNRRIIMPSKQYQRYEAESMMWIPGDMRIEISYPVNLKCVYYMPTRRQVDLVNLLEATCDLLVHAKVLQDDNCKIVARHDGSCVRYDKESPRVEIEIAKISE